MYDKTCTGIIEKCMMENMIWYDDVIHIICTLPFDKIT